MATAHYPPKTGAAESPLRIADGYRNLSQFITRYKLTQRTKGEGVAMLREVKGRSEGLVCLTGGDEGPLASVLERGGIEEGRLILRSLNRGMPMSALNIV